MAVLLAANVGFIPDSRSQLVNSELSALRWGMQELNERLASYGYGGIELHWSSLFRHCLDLRLASPQSLPIIARGVISGHEGWRGVADPVPYDTTKTPLRPAEERSDGMLTKIGSAVLLPTGAASLRHLKRLEDKLGRSDPMHYVMFPDPLGRRTVDKAKTARFPNSSIQPTADVGASWGVQTVGNFGEELQLRGYKATIDTFHISRSGKIVQNGVHWKSLIDLLLRKKLVSEVHVSVGRNDFASVDPVRYAESVDELKALVENGKLDRTPLGYIAERLAHYRWSGDVAIEATIPGLAATFGAMTPEKLADIHRCLTAGVRQLLPHISWESRF